MSEDELLERLRALAGEADAPPAHVLAGALAARTRVALEDELLDLRSDSFAGAAATTRAGPGTRVLRFGTPDCAVELEVAGEGYRTVVGQLDPAAGGEVELTHAGGVVRAPVDDLGRFRLGPVPPGPVSLAWTASAGRRVRTAWVAV